MELNWETIIGSATIVFAAGGSWFEIRRLRIDFNKHMTKEEPVLAEVPKLGVRVDRCEEDIKEMRPMILGKGGAVP